MDTMKPAYAYIRVSTEVQAADGVSLDAQRARVRGWCGANGYQLADVFVDAGLSGKRADTRPGLQAALAAVCKAKGAALVVYSLSRLARSTRDTLSIAERLDASGADLVSLSEKIDTTSACGKMVFRLLAVLAEFERDLVSERTTMALAHKRSKSEKTGGAVPFGYQLAADGVHLIADPHEQSIIGVIGEMRRAGWTYRTIAAELERRGLSPKNGNRWHPKVIRDIYRRAA